MFIIYFKIVAVFALKESNLVHKAVCLDTNFESKVEVEQRTRSRRAGLVRYYVEIRHCFFVPTNSEESSCPAELP
jgi:hypothetical protein